MSKFHWFIKAVVLSAFLQASRLSWAEITNGNPVGSSSNCTGFPSGFVGCWRNQGSDGIVFFDKTKMYTKNENETSIQFGHYSDKQNTTAMLCSSKDVTLSENVQDKLRIMSMRISRDGKYIFTTCQLCHQSEVKCQNTNHTTLQRMTDGKESCFKIFGLRENVEAVSEIHNRVIRSTMNRNMYIIGDPVEQIASKGKQRIKRAPTPRPFSRPPIKSFRSSKGRRTTQKPGSFSKPPRTPWKSTRGRRTKQKPGSFSQPPRTPWESNWGRRTKQKPGSFSRPPMKSGKSTNSYKGRKPKQTPGPFSKPPSKPGKSTKARRRKQNPGSKTKPPMKLSPNAMKYLKSLKSTNSKARKAQQKTASFSGRSMKPKKTGRPKKTRPGKKPSKKFDEIADATAKILSSKLTKLTKTPPKRRPQGKLSNTKPEKKGFDKLGPKPISMKKPNTTSLKSKSDKKSAHSKSPKKTAFAKLADLKAEDLSISAKKKPSVPRDRAKSKNSYGKKKEGKFKKQLGQVAKKFAKGRKNSPRDFDKLVDAVAIDLAKYTPSRGKHKDKVFIPRGKTVTLDCLKDEETRSPVPSMVTKWSKNGQPLAEGRYEVTKQGDLKIKEVESHDTGTYKCLAVVTNKNKKQKTKNRLHKVMVYRIPVVSYFFTIKFKTSGCDSVETYKMKAAFTKQVCTSVNCLIKDLLCKCPVGGKKMYIEGKVVLPPDYKMPKTCAVPSCRIKAMKDELHKNLKNIKKFVSAQKSAPGSFGKVAGVVYTDVYSCESGYEQSNQLCTTCSPGSYSREGDSACHRCPKNTYQANFGSLRCLKCKDGGTTSKPGSTSKVACKASLGLGKTPPIFIGAGSIVFLCCICVCCCICCKKRRGKKGKNKNNSNLSKMPSQPRYDKNSENVRQIEEASRSKLTSSPKRSSLSKSGRNTNVNNQPCDRSSATSPGITSSYTEYETKDVIKPQKLKSTERSMSESVVNNSMAARNAAIKEKSNAKSKMKTEMIPPVQSPEKYMDAASLKSKKRSCNSVRSLHRKDSTRDTKSRRGYHSSVHSGTTQEKPRTKSAVHRVRSAAVQRSPCVVASPERSVFSTPPEVPQQLGSAHSTYSTPSQGLHLAKHAESWYTSNWDTTDGGETLTTLSTLTKLPTETSSTYLSSSNSTRTLQDED